MASLAPAEDPRSPIRVMQSFRGERSTTNPYLAQLTTSLSPSITVVPFSWPGAIAGRYDVLHLHWPENLLRGAGGPKVALRYALFIALLVRLAASRIAVVRTLHNVSPHETGPRLERFLLGLMARHVSAWIRLNPATPAPANAPTTTILHGHYRDWFAQAVASEDVRQVSGRIVTFGLIRPYKGVEGLIRAFSKLGDGNETLLVMGKPSTSALAEQVRRLAAEAPRIDAVLEYTDDATLARAVREAQLVVLPYRSMHNSGALLLALSLDRPVLVPRSEVTAELAEEVGTDWVQLFDGDVDPSALRNALDAVASTPATPPDLSARKWPAIGRQHETVYREAVSVVRRRKGTDR